MRGARKWGADEHAKCNTVDRDSHALAGSTVTFETLGTLSPDPCKTGTVGLLKNPSIRPLPRQTTAFIAQERVSWTVQNIMDRLFQQPHRHLFLSEEGGD